MGAQHVLRMTPVEWKCFVVFRRAVSEVILTEQELDRLLHPDKAVAEHQLAAREAAERAFAQQNAAFKVLHVDARVEIMHKPVQAAEGRIYV
jgi:pyocin large subunit-like protein